VTVLLTHGLRGNEPIAEQRCKLGDGALDGLRFWLFEHDRQFLPSLACSATPPSGTAAEPFAAISMLAAVGAVTTEAVLIKGTSPIRIVDAAISVIAAGTLAIEIIGGAPVVGALPAILRAPLPAIVRVLIDIAVMVRIQVTVIPRASCVAIKTGVAIGLKSRVTV
jgi:hypothetical protein